MSIRRDGVRIGVVCGLWLGLCACQSAPQAMTPSEAAAPEAAQPTPGSPLPVTPLPQVLKHIEDDLGLQVSFKLWDLEKDREVESRHSDRALTPASVTKLVTSYLALKTLGPDFKFKTELRVQGKVSKGILNGDLWIVGGGDPFLVSERFWLLSNEIERLGIKKITGHVYLDTSYFEPVDRDERLIDEQTERAYNAALNPLTLNFNSVGIVAQVSADGKRVMVELEPRNELVKIIHQVQVGAGERSSLRARFVKATERKLTLEVSGFVGRESEEPARVYRSVPYPETSFYGALWTELKKRGMNWPAQAFVHPAPASARTILSFPSLPLYLLVDSLNKFSNNVMIDTILLGWAREAAQRSVALEETEIWVKSTLKAWGHDVNGVVWKNGSGLSREQRLSADLLMSIIRQSARDLSWGTYLLSSLPTSGVDGTLREQFTQLPVGSIKAKTGRIDGVFGLAGLVRARSGKIYAVVSLINDSKVRPKVLSQAQDELFQAIEGGL